ncbi:tetratricopeptide repeat protein [Altererythrobacter sp. H2]|uniref:tetratricopeptide repeat protein n=1 Tax=Altererythrobacter sp. H2 TaxID=3108391 RepID=UPI002B4C0E6B|nr:tetratricopeptide repeat protein [Altererythrobacter sp. H2]WRK97192.1 tetratricopeptide repeat protein [Altererythrobacter sp. H2]
MALTPTSNKTAEEKKAAQDEVLMREIDDAVREDQFAEFAARYGKPILGVVAAGLLAFAGYLWWDGQQEASLEADSETLVSALDQIESGNLDSGAATLETLIAEGNDGAAAMAKLLKAGVIMEQGKPADAARLYAEVAASGDSPPALRDLATVREIAATFDTRKPDEVIARLKPLAVPGNAYFGSAGEMVAMAYLEQGKRREAGTLFAEIARSEDVPEGLRSRSRQMAGLLGVDAIEDVNEVLEATRLDDGSAAPAPSGE